MGKRPVRRQTSKTKRPSPGNKATAEERAQFREDRMQEKAIVRLLQYKHTLPSESDRTFALSLCSQYEDKGHLSTKQWVYVVKLADTIKQLLKLDSHAANYKLSREEADQHRKMQSEKRRGRRLADKQNGGCYIYGITSGDAIKLGISRNPGKRLQDLQTSNSSPLALAWQIQAPTRVIAKAVEGRLHRRLKSFRLSGEWFNSAVSDEANHLAQEILLRYSKS